MNEQGTNNSDYATDLETLPLPRFDHAASAAAQPVEPIRPGRFKNLVRRIGSLGNRVSRQTRALAVVVILGLATGVLGGVLLVRNNHQPVEAEAQPGESLSQIPPAESQQLDGFAADLKGAEVQQPATKAARPRKAKWRIQKISPPRAYRVAVIRN